MGIRNINKIYEENDIIIKIVKESKLMYENEKYAYHLLNKHIPKMISFDDKKSSIVLEKINGKRLSKIKIEESAINFIKKNKNILILVSNSAPKWIDFILEKYGIKKYFKYIFYREYKIDDVKKPSKEVIKIIEDDINDNIDNSSLVIGDSYTDYLFAKNCNLKFICMYNRIEDCNSYKDFNEVDKLIKENI